MLLAGTETHKTGTEIVSALLDRWVESELDDSTDCPAREQQRSALLALRRQFEALPFGRIHPSWVARAIPGDPLLRIWCLSELPRAERLRVVRELPPGERPDVLCGAPPGWFGLWWHQWLRRTIGYPLPVASTTDRSAPFTYLDRLGVEELVRLLRCFGLRALAAGLRRLERRSVVALTVALPPVLRDRLAAHSRAGRYPDPAAWGPELRALRELEGAVDDLPLLLALEDVGAQAVAMDERCAAARLAYRLPARLGERLLARLEAGAARLAHSSPEQWQRDLVTDLGYLVKSGVVRSPSAAGVAA